MFCIDPWDELIYSLRYVIHFVGLVAPEFSKRVEMAGVKFERWLSSFREEPPPPPAEPKFLSVSDHLPLVEFNLQPDPGLYAKYADVVLQYGYLVLFASAWPIIFALSLFDNLIVIRLGAWRQCALRRRPYVELAENVGMWDRIMDTMSILGIWFNVAIYVFTGKNFDNYGLVVQIVFILTASQTLGMFKMVLHTLLTGTPQWITEIAQRQSYIVRKYLHGFDDNDEDAAADKALHEADAPLDDLIDVDGLSLYDFRKDKKKKMTRADVSKGLVLEKQRRGILHELTQARLALQKAYASESFDEITGMGKTLDGIPLGLLQIFLVDLSGVELLYVGADQVFVAARVLEDKDADDSSASLEAASPVFLLESDSGERVIRLDKEIGPLAPISSLRAVAVFELRRKEINGYSVYASAKLELIPLLSDQKPQEMSLKLNEQVTGEQEELNDHCFLRVRLTFSYSTISRCREDVIRLKSELGSLESQLALLKIGKSINLSD